MRPDGFFVKVYRWSYEVEKGNSPSRAMARRKYERKRIFFKPPSYFSLRRFTVLFQPEGAGLANATSRRTLIA